MLMLQPVLPQPLAGRRSYDDLQKGPGGPGADVRQRRAADSAEGTVSHEELMPDAG
jgi:hypothetical protein